MLQIIMSLKAPPAKAESYKTTHNFFVLEDGRSNSLLQTYKLLILQEI